MTRIDVCNMALSQLKCKLIFDLKGDTEEAAQCRLYYDTIRRNVLRLHPWNFAKKEKVLALTTHKSEFWKYSYVYPSDALYILSVFDSGNKELYRDMRGYYDIFIAEQERDLIGCNIDKAKIEYIYDVVNVSYFPDDFISLLVYRLAYTLAIPLAASSELQQLNYALYKEALSEARRKNRNELKEKARFESNILVARKGGVCDGDL